MGEMEEHGEKKKRDTELVELSWQIELFMKEASIIVVLSRSFFLPPLSLSLNFAQHSCPVFLKLSQKGYCSLLIDDDTRVNLIPCHFLFHIHLTSKCHWRCEPSDKAV